MKRTTVVGGLVLSALAFAAVPAQAATTSSRVSTPSASDELLYVANANNGPVTAYRALASGSVRPARTVANPNLPNAFWDPWVVTFDATHHLYVQSFLSEATSFVFRPDANGHSAPVRVFMANGPDTRSIAVDRHGFEYIASGQSSAVIYVVAPGANGHASNSYNVPTLRNIQTDETLWWPWADILTTDNQNDIVAAIVRDRANAIEIFKGGASGGTSPPRVISGPHTGLGSCPGPCDQMSVTFSPRTNEFFVAVSSASGTHISVFAGGAAGDVAPVRTIAGPNTGLSEMVITGIAVSQQSGEVYAMVKTADFGGQGSVDVFRPLAAGNAHPMRVFTDVSTRFADGLGIALDS